MKKKEMSEKAFDVEVIIRVIAVNKASAIDKVRDILNQVMKIEGVDYFIQEDRS